MNETNPETMQRDDKEGVLLLVPRRLTVDLTSNGKFVRGNGHFLWFSK